MCHLRFGERIMFWNTHQIIYGEKIGFIGLGKLGMPCAEAIRKKGFHVAGYDIVEKRSDLVEMRDSNVLSQNHH